MYDPFSGWRTTGTWQDHMSYSAGGIDKPLPFGTPLRAPAAGTLRTSGGSGEYLAGHVGSAGRRSILTLDDPVLNLKAIVFQHQSKFGDEEHYEEGEILGWSGASTANSRGVINERGGDVHLHDHGLTALGTRVDWRGYLSFAPSAPSSVASSNKTPLPPIDRNEDMQTVIRKQTGDIFNLWPAGIKHLSLPNQASISAKVQYENDEWLVVSDADFGDLIDAYCIPRDQVYGAWSNKRPAGHVWSAAGKALDTAAEAVRIGNENFKLLNTINAKLK
jgi:hypothetical protein